MIIFLTSSPTGDLDGKYTCEGLDTRNGFADCIREIWRENSKVLMITASPDADEKNAAMMDFFANALEQTGLSGDVFDLWDAHILEDEEAFSKEVLHSYDVIILGGGHVPTQRRFFEALHLKENIQGFDGIVIGISAGTMNSARIVYAQPEEPGEAVDPYYERFIPGLGITEVNVIPHYQVIKDYTLDGLKIFEEISLPDSMGREFIVLPDGSFVIDFDGPYRFDNGTYMEPFDRRVIGEAYLIKDGRMGQICQDGESTEF